MNAASCACSRWTCARKRRSSCANRVPPIRCLESTGWTPEQIDIFPVSDLEDLGLYGYLTEGCGVSPDQLDRDALVAIEGWVMVLRSAAFNGHPATLNPDPRLRLIGLFTEEATNWTGGTIETESAKPFSAPQTVTAGDTPRRVGSAILALVALLVIGGILWLIL